MEPDGGESKSNRWKAQSLGYAACIAVTAVVLIPSASAHPGAWNCEANAETDRFECEGSFVANSDLCYVEWTDNEVDNHYHDSDATVTHVTCVGRTVTTLLYDTTMNPPV